MHIPTLIERKRDGGELSGAEISEFIRGYTAETVPDYQVSAWAMAVFFRGMTPAETSHLTRAMMESGNVLRYPPGTPPKVDKHSTGGIGDKVSLILAPLLACDELWVPMISGRGLGITGGTLDKLESIPGFRVGLTEAETLAQLDRLGVAMIGQTESLCPADRKLYALRDVTATVPSQPLIIASIMSKKLAESLDRLVLDVKYGSGAFMKTRADGESLAAGLISVGEAMGVQMHHLLTPMDEPLGQAVGNALEVTECVETLQGRGPANLVNLTLDLAEKVSNVSRATLAAWLDDGTAWRKFVKMVEAQGGDAAALERLDEVHRAPVIREFSAESAGMLREVNAEKIGRACVHLGAGRTQASDVIDPRVGCTVHAKTRDRVEKGQLLLRVHAGDDASAETALTAMRSAFVIE